MENAVLTDDTDKPGSAIFLTGLFFGALTGFGAMMLLTPQSGKKTRIQIGKKSAPKLLGPIADTPNQQSINEKQKEKKS